MQTVRPPTKPSPHTGSIIPSDIAREVDQWLSTWYETHQRSLNFRSTNDPYAIMVSEFMLQQTTVAAVEPYFERFIKRFPTVDILAGADEDDVMSMWAGLGYYRRARQLHAAAKAIVALSAGNFAPSTDELQKLPGFGRYTAGAVVSQAFDLPAPILEANTIRVFARLAGIRGTVGDTKFMHRLWKVAEDMVSSARSPRIFNRSAMELGSLICRPRPLCHDCPVQNKCAAYIGGIVEETPMARPRRANVRVNKVCVVVNNSSDQYAVRRIPAGEWHAGLWEFPTNRLSEGQSATDSAISLASSLLSVDTVDLEPLTTLRYQVTHHKISCDVFHCQPARQGALPAYEETDVQFLSLQQISQLPLGSAQKKLLQILNRRALLEA